MATGEVLTDGTGRPIPRPVRADYPTDRDFLAAYQAWRDEVARVALDGFARGWRDGARR